MAFDTTTVTPGTGKTVNLFPNAGQATMSNSVPMAVASDQSAIPVTPSLPPLAAKDATVAAITTALGTPAQEGTDATGVTPPTGAVGIRGWLSSIWNKLNTSIAVTAASLPLPTGAATAAGLTTLNTTLGTPAQDGTDATGVTPPAGAVGVRGWLSSIWNKLNTSIAVTVASLPLPTGAATNAGSASLATNQVSVTTGNITVVASRAGRLAVTIENITGTAAVYLGVTGVSTANGYVLPGVAGASVTIPTTAAIFGTVASVTQNICFFETF